MSIVHPLKIGTQIRVRGGGSDGDSIMSWDDTDTEIDRVAPPGSVCVVTAVTPGNLAQDGQGTRYDVVFVPSEVWNILDEADFRDMGDALEIVAMGDGTLPKFYTDHFENPETCERDPEAVRKIAEAQARLGMRR